MRYLTPSRAKLGGYLPRRETPCATVAVPPLASTPSSPWPPQGKEMSTTMAFVRLLTGLLKDATLGPRIVPIVADEARTFGMANLFKQVGIYSSAGQQYAPEDIGSHPRLPRSHRRANSGRRHRRSRCPGQLDGGGHQLQRARPGGAAVLHLLLDVWLPARGRSPSGPPPTNARGAFCCGRRRRAHHRCGGGGLRRQDGSSHLVAATIPNCKAYDPAFAGELAGDPGHRHARDAGRAARCFLLRHAR